MSEATTNSNSKRNRIIAISVAALVVLGLIIWLVFGRSGGDTAEPTPVTTQSPSATAPASPSASPSADPEACQPTTEEGFVPTRLVMTNPEADSPVLSLGQDSDGAIAAPPLDEPRTASWWNGGPTAGSQAGKVVLSIHTYRTGDALGNEMYADGESTLQPGDIIKLYGEEGEVACYEFVEAKKVWVDEYDPDSDVMVDFEGDPLLTMIICWDFQSDTEEWDSRIFFYAKPITT